MELLLMELLLMELLLAGLLLAALLAALLAPPPPPPPQAASTMAESTSAPIKRTTFLIPVDAARLTKRPPSCFVFTSVRNARLLAQYPIASRRRYLSVVGIIVQKYKKLIRKRNKDHLPRNSPERFFCAGCPKNDPRPGA